MRILFYLFGVLVLFSSCASINMTDLKPYPKNSSLLPALEPRIDMHSLESAYSMGQITGTSRGYSTAITNNSVIGIAVTSSTMTKDPRVQDAITIFDRDVKENITNPYGDKKGYILCKIAAQGTKTGGYGWSVLSGLTLLIPNLIGMPFGLNKTSLDLEIEIYDLKEKLVGKYNAQSYDETWLAMYHGYSTTDAPRISSIKAFKSAMNDIKSQIDKDSMRLNKELNK